MKDKEYISTKVCKRKYTIVAPKLKEKKPNHLKGK